MYPYGYLSHLGSRQQVHKITSMDRMHDKDVWPCSIPKSGCCTVATASDAASTASTSRHAESTAANWVSTAKGLPHLADHAQLIRIESSSFTLK